MKRTPVKQFLLCLILVGSLLSSNAQVVTCYFPEDFTVDPGMTIVADVKVDSFINLVGLAFSVNWDPAVLRYKEVTNVALEMNQFSGFNEGEAESQGKFGLLWLASDIQQGETYADSTTIFSIVLEAIGNPMDTTSLQFSDDPVTREAISNDQQSLPLEFEAVSITLNNTSQTNYNSAPDRITVLPVQPNPFHEGTTLPLILEHPAQTQITVIDQQGKVYYNHSRWLGAGQQRIALSDDIFTHSGTYYCLLRSADFVVHQKLVYINR